MNRRFSLMVSLDSRVGPILVVGGGCVGERKVRTILSADFPVTLISPTATSGLQSLASKGLIKWHAREVTADDFLSHRLAVIALAKEDTEKILPTASKARCLVDCCGAGELGDWSLAAQFRTETNLVGVGSFGKSPSASADLRMNIQSWMESDRERPILFSRKSALARAQTMEAARALAKKGLPVEIKTMSTCGDEKQDCHLSAFGGNGAFVKCLEEAIMEGKGDGAIHSLKDVPSVLPDGLELVAVLPRASTSDVIVSNHKGGLEGLPAGAVVGTSSLRRKAQLAITRPDLDYTLIRGNVNTRLAKLQSGDADAIVLAKAGLDRLGISPEGATTLPFLPAPCQGIIAVEARSGSRLAEEFRAINHRPTWLMALAERELLESLQVGCHVPFAALSEWVGGELRLRAQTLSYDGRHIDFEGSLAVRSDDDARDLGRDVALSIKASTEAISMLEEKP
ncbi:porphobilinogen deaminase [Dethiosulfovibrio peptidovorans DSM 11002]|uniref:Porphobilinogen deaminase n=1 Tax=Dethiosulfovibrio peptidovorans DSM 11002 TaxID=469381 RepID=D2Z8E8_9BACT|nr:hydroxymethylbilane synthase [Dethiosulfovibrio peptidovorans]EFC91745.1 porphobilinogen deaminase [Dethiosulfovibrio peptidovorans DSM 11002]